MASWKGVPAVVPWVKDLAYLCRGTGSIPGRLGFSAFTTLALGSIPGLGTPYALWGGAQKKKKRKKSGGRYGVTPGLTHWICLLTFRPHGSNSCTGGLVGGVPYGLWEPWASGNI